MAMILSAAAHTDVGLVRRANEDHHTLAPELGLYIVADGMGGHAGGQLASDLACQALLRAIEARVDSRESLAEQLRLAVAEANHEVFSTAQGRPELTGMGTTVVALLARGGRAALAHVGDSRVYRVRDGRIRQLTDDHSLVGELVRRRELSADAAKGHPHRHVLTRALGVRRRVEPDLAELTPAAGDVFVLCSDGVTAHVGEDEFAKVLAAEVDLQSACEGFVDLANSRGGEDNSTIVLVRCESD